ncbi:hypothetical protein K4F85_03565 [Phaeobacter inhibens]|uniref:hypothetical protein n=1 Tax=Phaeobacter inhibens TaxID=221822 RepID=UPI0021A5EC1C|nr:hypothetical protein [Phaeobacter inhibens]UWR41990.1 hypothetical protein K4F85_03565 [Phaeobacter inhibens]
MAVEVYFILQLGKSPIYFKLSDFLNPHGIELFYVSVTIFILAPWIAPPAYIIYATFFHALKAAILWPFKIIKYNGQPLFKKILESQRSDEIAIDVAKNYCKEHKDSALSARIESWEDDQNQRNSLELVRTTSLSLFIAMALISSKENPNFLMKVSDIASQWFSFDAYRILVFLIISSGLLGRLSNFQSLRKLGYLPQDFITDPVTREGLKEWPSKMVENAGQKYMDDAS